MAYKSTKTNPNFERDPEFKAEIMRRLQLSMSEKQAEHETLFKILIETLKYPEMLSTFSFESGDDIEDAILYSILNLKNKEIDTNPEIFEKQLKLALTWNRYDIAENKILKSQILDVITFELKLRK